MGRLHRRYRKRRKNPEGGSPRANPPLIQELGEFIAPGFVGFAATRFGTRIAATQIAKRKPGWAKHAGAVASISAFLAAWLLAHRVKALAKYQMPIAVGAGLAALQSIIQLYIPKLGWIVADASPEMQAMPIATAPAQLPAGLQYVDEDPAHYTYNDAYDAGRYNTGAAPAPAHIPDDGDEVIDIDLDQGPEESMQGVGIFGAH
jgi:hypothetical protein